MENAFRLGPRLLSGGEPNGDRAFAALAAAGVKVVVSVDGAAPDLEGARRHGMRYVHIPIGYDGVSEPAQVALASLVEGVEGGIFVHCHHGRHRGPAAAAVLAVAGAGWSPGEATGWMKIAGTSPEYPGLYLSVEAFRMPPRARLDEARGRLRPEVKPVGLVESMVIVDGQAEALADMKAAGWKPLAATPDETPIQSARLLAEQFREASRLGLGPREESFRKAMLEATASAARLESCLRNGDTAGAEAAWRDVRAGCVSCHKAWRN